MRALSARSFVRAFVRSKDENATGAGEYVVRAVYAFTSKCDVRLFNVLCDQWHLNREHHTTA